MDDPNLLSQPGDWKYKLAFRFPLPKRGGQAFMLQILELGAWLNATLRDGRSAAYDGNSLNGETMDLSIWTDAPQATFKRLRSLVEEHAPRPDYIVAFRKLKTHEWTTLWPESAASSTPVNALDDPSQRERDEVAVEPEWKYQLVFQFPFLDADLEQFDKVIALEDQLAEATEDDPIAEVDGHDAGSGEMNIFLMTNEPRGTYKKLQTIIRGSAANHATGGHRAAYRAIDEDDYHLLWPDNGEGPPFTVT
jgi:hypothetical protein